ncbi:MAG TPA: fibronectin type III domain-containing protein [Desulfotomaculum sp.]|nr:MAG: hypothetical protein JL56_05860 [Desulfotomaculum sp. BICA1-6]HBX23984.1 fibronectin type III domain-containing protein [Desulfotomaculum sp.]
MKIIAWVTKILILIVLVFMTSSIAYAGMQFDPDNTQLFDPSDSNNIGYYLNNDFYNSLSQKDLIETSSWDISVQAKIGLISYNEFKSYGIYYGGSLLPSSYSHGWWTRTPYSTFPDYVYIVNISGNLNSSSSVQNIQDVKPVLYLKSNLMLTETKEVKESAVNALDSEAPGEIIIFSGLEWIILEHMQDGTTYVILNTTIDDAIPLPPTGLHINNITDTSARVNWVAVDEAIEYVVYLDGNEVGRTFGIYLNFNNLTPSTTYQVQVSAVKDGIESEKCNPVSFTTDDDLGGEDPPDDPIWTPLPGPGMGFSSDIGSVFETMKLFFNMFKGSLWPFIITFLSLFTVGLLWKLWRRASQ